VSESAVGYWVQKYGVQKGYNDPQVVEYLYCEREWSIPDIADHFNCSEGGVHTTLQEHDIETRDVGRHRRVGIRISVEDGYVKWKNFTTSVHVHQLLAIADGADPHKVFSGRDYHVHHKNHIPFDNRPSNLELMTASAHTKLHWNEGRSVA